ncbi:uncharacterized protein LOC135693746 [Rhopilema esculentum]|uniref:uncharacterized protein LOC135693746 n=1 Tax=Rhopilema esculentum TaxID=499914 RepID=UPI0031E0EDFB|eukprot:gene10189-18861_t
MQMLETIQEYVPFKHSFGYFSSWIASRYRIPDHTSQEDEQNNENDDKGSLSEACSQITAPSKDESIKDELDAHQKETGTTETLMCETTFISPAPEPQEKHGQPNSHQGISSSSNGGYQKGANDDDSYTSGTENGKQGCVGSKIESFLYNNIPLDDCSCASDSENDNLKSDSKTNGKEKKRLGSHSLSKKMPLFLKGRRKKKRRGSTLSDYKSSLARIHCACAIGGDELCLVHLKSHSESDINVSRYKRSEDYSTNGDLSDISVTSFSLAEDDSSSGSYVDIDLRYIRKSLLGSGSWSKSDRSIELSSDWSEIHRTISDPSLCEDTISLAEECRESDIPDTASDFSQDSRTQVSRVRSKHVRSRIKRMPFGHNVNESFVENECFCCHCIVM